ATGRLFTTFDASAAATATTGFASGAAACEANANNARGSAAAPATSSASTITNSPAVRITTGQATPRAMSSGARRRRVVATSVAATPSANVTTPSAPAREAVTTSTTAARTSVALAAARGAAASPSARCSGARTSFRNNSTSAAYVSASEAIAGSANDASQLASGGMPSAKNRRFAGFAIGSVKLAAFATSAHATTNGAGSASVRASAARTAGVSTTIVASFERNVVVTIPAAYTSSSSRARDAPAARTACVAIQSNTPSTRANSASAIIPTRNRYTSIPRASAPPACCGERARVATSATAPPAAHHASFVRNGRTITPRSAAAARTIPSRERSCAYAFARVAR